MFRGYDGDLSIERLVAATEKQLGKVQARLSSCPEGVGRANLEFLRANLRSRLRRLAGEYDEDGAQMADQAAEEPRHSRRRTNRSNEMAAEWLRKLAQERAAKRTGVVG